MSTEHDLIVIGAGPAGASAAIEAATLGLSTVLIDEQADAGGQVHRAPIPALNSAREHGAGNELRRALAASNVRCVFERRVWLVERGFRVACLGPDGAEEHRARALIVASGAQERHLPVPGWTLPGVIGLAAATILLKSEGVLPGRRVVVAGAGPLLLLVAAKILAGGGEVACIVDLASRGDWLRSWRDLASRPDLVAQGAAWSARILTRGVPYLSRHALRRIEGTDAVARVVVGPVTAGREQTFDCDAVCYGMGLSPATDITRLLRATHRYDADAGGWQAVTGPDGATDVPLLYVCGDGAGLRGAAAAPLGGRIAALAAARDLGRVTPEAFQRRAAPLQPARARAARFGKAMAALMQPLPRLVEAITPETIVCRCEGLTRATLDAAIAAGATSLGGLKSATRCGMGPCGGRVCGDAAALLIAAATGRPVAEIDPMSVRPPLRPVPLDLLTGAFDYDDLPIPEPAPL